MILPFSHDARMPRQQDALAVVHHLPFVSRRPIAVRNTLDALNLEFDANGAGKVQPVKRCIDVAKVGYSVISAVMVDVINNIRLFVVNKVPGKPVRVVVNAAHLNANVPRSVNAARGLSYSRPMVSLSPNKHPRFRVVGENVANRIWYKFCSHIAPLCGLVRGLTVGAVSAPILTRESNDGR